MVKDYFSLSKGFIFLVFFLLPCFLVAQKGKSSNSAYAGNINFSVGHSNNFYSQSKLKFIGSGYNFSLDKVGFWQKKPAFSLPDFNKIISSQFSVRLGYNMRRGVNISLGIDRLQYGIKTGQTVSLNGYVSAEADTIMQLAGQYTNELIDVDSARIQFGTNLGMSFINLQLNLLQNLYRSKKRNFVINAVYGIGAGVLQTNSMFNFGGFEERNNSLSGFGLLANAGMRCEFFKYFYLQPNLSASLLNQVGVYTHQNAAKNKVSHVVGAFNTSVSVGLIIYLKSKKDCDCPVWN